MKPTIDGTKFGSITISGELYEHDVLIRLSGKVKKRKKKLSKAVYGTSHKLSLIEAEHIYRPSAERLIIGTGQNGLLDLSDEAAEFFHQKGLTAELLPTPEAIKIWNKAKGPTIAMFHVTC